MKISSETKFRIFAILFFLALSCLSLRNFIFEGRFWAEEGVIFYPELLERGWRGVFSHTFQGHLEFFTNLVVYLSTLVEIRYAPLVTTYLSFSLQSLPFLLLIFNRKALGLSKISTVLFIALTVISPGAFEVAANSINLHFHFALLSIIVLLLPVTRLNNVFLLMSGFSGIPSNALAPFYLYEAYKERDRKRLCQFFILAFTGVVQLLLIIDNQAGIHDRKFLFDPLLTLKVFVSQELVQPLMPYMLARNTLTLLGTTDFLSWIVLVPFCIIFGYIVCKALRGNNKERLLILINLFLGCFFVFTALNGSLEIFAPVVGSRYFYPVFATLVLILLYWFEKCRSLKIIFAILCAVALMNSYFYAQKGPSWEVAYQNGKATQTYEIWPTGWKMDLTDDQKMQQ